MNATISTHLASVMTSRDASQRLRTSECIRVPAAPHLVRPGYVIGDQLWTHLQVGVPGTQVDLDVRLLTTRQALGGERRWFACPNCSRRVGCLYARGSPSRSGAASVTICSTTANSPGATPASTSSRCSCGWTGRSSGWGRIGVATPAAGRAAPEHRLDDLSRPDVRPVS